MEHDARFLSAEEVEAGENSRSVPESQYRHSSSLNYDEDDGVIYDSHGEPSHLNIVAGLKFETGEQFKEAVSDYCISIGADIKWNISTDKKKRAVCRQNCGWYVYGSWHGGRQCFMVKNVGSRHSCPRALRMKGANAVWAAKRYIGRF
ncbi:unnamed protein product [Linum trigynum]|uniref:Transposase MuDR plant domain-containing protein n=1 Tax=Linum trigynum TaxID=586398 RepID=A0AAV2EUF3_9ROSI